MFSSSYYVKRHGLWVALKVAMKKIKKQKLVLAKEQIRLLIPVNLTSVQGGLPGDAWTTCPRSRPTSEDGCTG